MRKRFTTNGFVAAIRAHPHDVYTAAVIAGCESVMQFRSICTRRGTRPNSVAADIIAGRPVILLEPPLKREDRFKPLRVPKMKLAEAARRFADDVEAAAQASGFDCVFAYRAACHKARVDIGEWSFLFSNSQKLAVAGDDDGDPWTPNDLEEFANLWMRRPMVSMAAISQRIGRSMSAVQTASSRFGFPSRERVSFEELARLRSEGRIRICLSCEREHLYSTWKGHRRCDLCKAQEAGMFFSASEAE